MPSRRTPSPDGLNVMLAFVRVRDLVAEKFPALAKAKLIPNCPRAAADHRADPRAYMHALHHPNAICTCYEEASHLSDNHLLAMFLHEFAHLAMPQDPHRKTEAWVYEHFGIPVTYKGPHKLEWAPTWHLQSAGLLG